MATTLACFAVVSFFSPHLSRIEFDTIDNPIGLPHSLTNVMEALAGFSLLLGLVTSLGLAVACVVQQYRDSGPLTRQQSLIFGLAFVPPVIAFAASLTDSAGPWLFGVCTLPLPVAIGIAVLQRRLYDLPLVVNRSATYALLWLAIAALYAVIVGGVGAMLQQQGAWSLPWLAAGVVAVSFAPLRDTLQRAANRLTFGQWAQPSEVLNRTARRLSDAGDVQGLPRPRSPPSWPTTWVWVTSRSSAAMAGCWPPAPDRRQRSTTSPSRRTALRSVPFAGPATLAGQRPRAARRRGHPARLGRARTRASRHPARRPGATRACARGGAPPPATRPPRRARPVARRADAAGRHRPQHRTRGDQRRRLLALRGHIQDAVSDVRSIVEGLQPAALADLGLVESLRQLTARFDHLGGSTVDLEADVPASLPAAVEVGAYRIVQESFTNAASHSGARDVRVDVHLDGTCLEVCVSDDGSGDLRPRPDGLGLTSMRERAEEIGGRLEVVAQPGRGTTRPARLPVDGRSRPMIPVLVVDDHPLFRDGLAGLLRTVPEVELLGPSATARPPSDMAATSPPTWS